MTRHTPVLTPPEDDRPSMPRLRLALAWGVEMWERLWRVLWPAATVVALFVAVALLDVFRALGGWGHTIVLAGFALALLAAVAWLVRGLRWPGPVTAQRRLERDSRIPHRPLTALTDHQATGLADAGSRALWTAYLSRQYALAGRLRVALPAPEVARLDPFALRGLVGLLLVLAIVASGTDWRGRLGDAFDPRFPPAAAAVPPSLDVFITPPAYTRVPPIYLRPAAPSDDGTEAADAGVVSVPVGSTLLARVTGGEDAPTLIIGSTLSEFEDLDGRSFEIERAVHFGERLAVEQDGTELGAWPITVVPDTPPEIDFAEPPSATERGALRLSYVAFDDYGLEAVRARVVLHPDVEIAVDLPPIDLDLTLPGHWPLEADGVGFFDLTPHPWAGLDVLVRLSAADAPGRVGSSPSVRMTLPERIFNHPVARAIIEQRRTLMLQPGQFIEVSEALEDLSARPDRYYDDTAVFLALRTVVWRLRFTDDLAAAIDPVQRLLWDTALRIEDGDLSLAERELRDIQQRLMEALASDASDEEIRALMDELRAAMDRYLQALAETMMEQMAEGEMPPIVDPNSIIDSQQLGEMLDRIEDLSQSGAREAAQEMLSQLQQLMENLNAGIMPQMQSGENPAMGLLEDLQNLARAQQELLDQTFQQSQQDGRPGQPGEQGRQQGGPSNQSGRPGGQPGQMPGQQGPGQLPGPLADGAATQEALRRALGELMLDMGEMMGDIPAPLGRAEQAMRESSQALGAGQPGEAVGPQTEAVDELQQGMQSFVDQLLEQMAESGMPMGVTGQQPLPGRDPLGRPMNRGAFDTDDVHIPDEADLQRARRILDELRRRLGERHRPELELDYIERLLRRF